MDMDEDDPIAQHKKKKLLAASREGPVGETKLERRRRLGRERRRRWWAKKNEQELMNARRHESDRRRKRYALIKEAGMARTACLHCNSTDSITIDVHKITFSANGQIFTLGECYTLITGIKIERNQVTGRKICQSCQNQLIAVYNFKRQYLMQKPKIKQESANPTNNKEGNLNFATVIVSEYGLDTKPEVMLTSLPDLGPPIMPTSDEVDNQCELCTMRFNSLIRYQRHMKNHAEKYICEHCGFQTSYKPQIRDHLMIHTKGYECGVCNEKFPNRILLKQHQQIKHIVSNMGATELVPEDLGIKIQCAYCGIFVYKVSMRSHMQTHANSMKCDQCNKTFRSRKNLASHVWSAHNENLPENFIKCEFCPQVYLKQIYMDRHLEKVHGSQPKSQPSSENVVPYQPQAGTQQPTAPAVTEPANELTIKCDLCPKLFTRLINLDRHMAKVHINNLPYICHTCGNCYDKESRLYVHMKTHDGKHECQICHARFAYSTGLFHHIKKIHTETCFKCSVAKCDEVMVSKAMLDHHSNIHSPAMGTECSVCEETFENFFALYDHYELKHRLVKSFFQRTRQDNCKCLHCGKYFPTLNTLKFHLVAKTLGTKHTADCKYCVYQPIQRKKKNEIDFM